MSDYEKSARLIENSIRLGIYAEAEWDGPSIKPGDLTDEQIAWLAAWLAGEGFIHQGETERTQRFRKPRVTEFLGYSAETSAPNEQPRWGHFTARFADEVQERFEKWLAAYDAEYMERLADEIDFPENDRSGDPTSGVGEAEKWLRQQAAARRGSVG